MRRRSSVLADYVRITAVAEIKLGVLLQKRQGFDAWLSSSELK
jgi:hypothetical protein